MFPQKIFSERCFVMHSLPLRVRSCIPHPTRLVPFTRSYSHPTRLVPFTRSYSYHSRPISLTRSYSHPTRLVTLCICSCISQHLIRLLSLATLALPSLWRMKDGWLAKTNGRVAGMSHSPCTFPAYALSSPCTFPGLCIFQPMHIPAHAPFQLMHLMQDEQRRMTLKS